MPEPRPQGWLSLPDLALDQLSLGRAYLQQATTPAGAGPARDQPPNHGHGPLLQQAEHWLNLAVAGLRAAGYQEYLILGLLTHAAYCRHTKAATRLIAQTGYKRRLPELEALQQSLGLN